MDNFFTSRELADILFNEHKLTTLGTLKSNRNMLPLECSKPVRPVRTSIFGFLENCNIVSYIPREIKNVILLSTFHEDDAIDDNTGKSEMIISHNKTKGAWIL